MRIVNFLALTTAVLLTACIGKPKSIKKKLVGSWVCTQSDMDFHSRSLQLLFYKNDTFYWYLKERKPTPYARGIYEVEKSKVNFRFNDTGEQIVFKIVKLQTRLLEVEYNGNLVTFKKIAALKTLP